MPRTTSPYLDAPVGREQAAPELCPNCGAEALGAFCHVCGQEHEGRAVPLRRLVASAAGDVFSFDNRLVRTLVPLLFRPGFLTEEYLAGRRARYVPPFRLYLVVSLIHFLVLTRFQTDWFFFTSIRSATNDPEVARRVMDALPQIMFLLMPVFAVLLAAAYARQRRLFVEHLIFALRFHAFAYLILTLHAPLQEPVRRLLFGGAAVTASGRALLGTALVLELAVPIYLLFALRRVYGQNWALTLAKGLVVHGAYVFVVLHYAALAMIRWITRA